MVAMQLAKKKGRADSRQAGAKWHAGSRAGQDRGLPAVALRSGFGAKRGGPSFGSPADGRPSRYVAAHRPAHRWSGELAADWTRCTVNEKALIRLHESTNTFAIHVHALPEAKSRDPCFYPGNYPTNNAPPLCQPEAPREGEE